MPYVGKKPADIIATAVDTTTGTFSGDIDVDGTTNLDVVDIDGAVDMATTLAVTGALSAKGGAVFNEDSADVDFRVESNGNTHMLFVEGGTDKVGISTSSPASLLTIGGNANTTAKPTVAITDTTNGATMSMRGQSPKLAFDVTSSGVPKILMDNAGAEFKSGTLDAEGDVHLKIDSTGAITKPLQPAFQVNPSSNQLNMANGETIVFGTERFDQNSDFSSNTFTAPVTGKYQLQLTARVDQLDRDANWVRIEMVTSNLTYEANIIDPDAFDKDPDQWSFNFSVLADMDANDTVFLRWGQSGGVATADFDTQAHFSGFLVC
jgi:hypothetical protein